jgi:hypothetical protein
MSDAHWNCDLRRAESSQVFNDEVMRGTVRHHDGLISGGESGDSIEEVLDSRVGRFPKLLQADFEQRNDSIGGDPRIARECLDGFLLNVGMDFRRRSKAAALENDGAFIQDLGGSQDVSGRRKHCCIAESEIDEKETRESMVHLFERITGKFHHIDLDAALVQIVEKGREEDIGSVR